MPRRSELFASCSPGLEPALLAEARALRLAKTEGRPGGVRFTGTIRDARRANLRLRTASRVLMELARFPAPDADALHRGVSGVDWERFLRVDGTFLVDGRTKQSALDHGRFVEQRTKDAVADFFRARHGRRPSVDREDPDLRIQVRIHRDRATVLADTSGEPLFKRGWRRFQGPAPLKETLAAGMLLLAGWDRRAPVLDPFCGSGTILAEAALLAAGVPPGALGRSFGFERWPGHDEEAWRAELAAARGEGEPRRKLVLRGSDTDPAAIEGARENLEAAGLTGRVELHVADAADFAPRSGWNAFVVTNPPYGERIGAVRDLRGVHARFGKALRAHCAGYTVAVLSSKPVLLAELRLPAGRRVALKNGPLDCELAIVTL